MVQFRTHLNCNELLLRRSRLGLATCDQVRSRPTRGIFDDIGNERSKDNTDSETEDGDMNTMCARLEYDGPEND